MKKKYHLEPPFNLFRDSDGWGDQGSMLNSIDPKTMGFKGKNGDVYLGCCIQCGSQHARTMQWQDWWLTTPIIEFISATDTEIRFKTKNSVYTLRGKDI